MAQKIKMDDAVRTLLEGSLCSFLTGRLRKASALLFALGVKFLTATLLYV